MRRARKGPDSDADSRPKLNVNGVGKLLGISKGAMYRRIQRKAFSLEGIQVVDTTGGKLYDMEGVFNRVFPSADPNTIAGMMYDFMNVNDKFKTADYGGGKTAGSGA